MSCSVVSNKPKQVNSQTTAISVCWSQFSYYKHASNTIWKTYCNWSLLKTRQVQEMSNLHTNILAWLCQALIHKMSSSTRTRVFLNIPHKLNLKSVIRRMRLVNTIFGEPIWLVTVVLLGFVLTFHFSIPEPRFFCKCFDTEDIRWKDLFSFGQKL